MNKINSFEQYQELISKAKHSGWKLSNCFFLPAAVRRMTAEGTLFSMETENGILLLDDQRDFFRCYYYLPEDGQPACVTLDQDAVIEFPFNGEMDRKQLLQVSKIEAMGFRLDRESRMMTAAPKDLIPEIGENDKKCHTAVPEDAAEVLALLRRLFNPLYSFLPDGEEIDRAIREGRVLVIRQEGKVGGALVSSFEKNVASVDQVAVDPAFRRRGFARALMLTYHNQYRERAAVFRHWVDINNAPAVSMYLNFGYRFSLRRANEYIMKVTGE